MHLGLKALEDFLETHQAEPYLVLATVVATEGSTYRKPGAMMLIGPQEDFAGLISGGCLEGDLVSRARAVLGTGEPAHVHYDLKDDDDLVFGLGLGCGGAVHLLLQRLAREDGFAPLGALFDALGRGAACRLALVMESASSSLPVGSTGLSGADGTTLGPPLLLSLLAEEAHEAPSAGRTRTLTLDTEAGRARALLVHIRPTPRVLVCGAGPDALPLVDQVLALGWHCTVVDHREAFADPARFPDRAVVVCERPERLAEAVDLEQIDAAVVMNHHVEHDTASLAALSLQAPAYLGLLGPRARRDQLLADAKAPDLPVHGPAGIDIGAELPEAIALSIMAEIHAVLNDRTGGALDHD